MPLTLACDPGIESRQAETTEVRAVAVGTRTRTRTRVDVDDLVPERVGPTGPQIDIVDEWGMQSFPASDPRMNW